jgi:hypothetical protein
MTRFLLPLAACLAAACRNTGEHPAERIVLDTVVRLQTGPGAGELPLPPLCVVAIPDGGYLAIVDGVTGRSDVELRNQYDAAGHYTGSLGRAGDGPGEFRRVVAAAGFAGDSIYIWDRQRRLMTVLDHAGRQVRTFSVSADGFQLVAAADGHFVLDGYAAGGNYSEPLNGFASDGKLIAAFGEVAPRERFAPGPPVERRVASDGHGGWWTARAAYRYELEHWDSTLTRRMQLLPSADWFPPQRDLESPTHGEEVLSVLRPGIRWLEVDSTGRLWIGGAAPVPGAQAAVDACVHGGGRPFECALERTASSFTTVVEVRSPSDGHLLASVRGLAPMMPMGGGLFRAATTDEDGFVRVSVVRVRME